MFGFKGVARRVVKQLAKVAPRVIVVDPDLSPAEQATLQRYGVEFVVGFGQSRDVLDSVNIAQASAAVCVTGDDLRNIEIALLVRELSAEIRLVVQMANGNVGTALQGATQPSEVLDVAALASLSFVEAVVQRKAHSLMLGEHRFFVTTVRNRRAGRLRDLWGEIAPIAARHADRGATIFTPSRDDQFGEGDSVMLLGTESEIRTIGFGHHLETARPRPRGAWSRTREGISATVETTGRPFRLAIMVIAALAALSTAILLVGYEESDGDRMSLLDAVYFTVETIATVGYGDFYFRGQAAWLQAWGIVMMFLGATIVYTAVAFLTQALVSHRLESALGRQRATRMRHHIVVVGLGAVGRHVALDLRAEGYEVVVIDQGSGQRFVSQLRNAGIPVLVGDPALPEVQREAGVQHAAGVAILGNDDLLNIETGLATRSVLGTRDVPVALRVFGRNLARVIDSRLDIGVTRSVAELAAPWFVGAAMGLEIVGTFYVDEAPFLAARIRVRADGALADSAIADLGVATRFIAIDRAEGDFDYPLQRDTVIHTGDSAYVVGRFEDLLDLLRN